MTIAVNVIIFVEQYATHGHGDVSRVTTRVSGVIPSYVFAIGYQVAAGMTHRHKVNSTPTPVGPNCLVRTGPCLDYIYVYIERNGGIGL